MSAGSEDAVRVEKVEISPVEGTALVEDLLKRCRKLLDELESFGSFIQEAKQNGPSSHAENIVDIKQFHGPVLTEMKSLQKLAAADPNAEKTIHTLKSSNLPFYSAIWEAAKGSRALVTFHKRFYWGRRPTRDMKRGSEKRCALVDIVAHDGEEWIKVSTTSEQRLTLELAKARWEAADSSDESEREIMDKDAMAIDTGNKPVQENDDEVDRMELVRTANDLVRASEAHTIHYEHPRVRFVLPKISDPPPIELAPLLERVRSTGAIVHLGDLPATETALEDLRTKVFPRLLPSPHPPLTNILNIDCTILLALVSDLSHTANHPIKENYNAAIRRQIELETREHLLPSSLWPAMAGKTLVCTAEAAKRMREIVETIGMLQERARTDLIMENERSRSVSFMNGSIDSASYPRKELHQLLQEHSDYTIPSSFNIPIRIMPPPTASDVSTAIQSGKLPAVAEQISEELTDINRSVFMYGWLHGFTTVSSNRTVAKAIESTIEKRGLGEKGPEIWLREPARSLLGKEKERRK